jgi:hypothetical protein
MINYNGQRISFKFIEQYTIADNSVISLTNTLVCASLTTNPPFSLSLRIIYSKFQLGILKQ